MASEENIERANELKEEGNALFAAKKWKAAKEKYTSAIELDNTKAVYFANRAACYIGLEEFQNAVNDGETATKLESTYAKGWGRLASAHEKQEEYEKGIDAYKRALEVLPSGEPSPAEKKQKEVYQQGLYRCETGLRAKEAPMIIPKENGQKMPWLCAAELLPELKASGVTKSSVWANGITKMKQTTKFRNPDGSLATMGPCDVNVDLTNAIMIDRRVFHISDQNFSAMIRQQLTMEMQHFKTFPDSAKIIRDAKKCLASNGWDDVRPALSATIRILIIQAYFATAIGQDKKMASDLFDKVLKVLDRGRQLWHDVSSQERGVIFSDTFVRGVRALHLEAYFQACSLELPTTGGQESGEFSLPKLMSLAEGISDETRISERPTSEDYGFIMAFYDVPLGEALAVKGFCYRKMARYLSGSPDEMEEFVQKSADSYYEASQYFAEDDELRYWHIMNAINSFFRCGNPLEVTMPKLEELRLGIPKMKRLWEVSQLQMGGRDKSFQKWLWVEEDLKKGLESNKYTMKSQMTPPQEELGEL